MEEFEKQENEMQKQYSAYSSVQMVETEPQLGLPCVVRYTENNLFYRSQITKLGESTAEVLFVDYGISQETLRTDLKRMTSKFMHLPQMVNTLLSIYIFFLHFDLKLKINMIHNNSFSL